MPKKQTEQKLLAIELILEDGMSTSAAADMDGETPETVEKWLADYEKAQEDKMRVQEPDLIAMQKRIAELQEDIAIHRATYDLIIDHPDLESEKLAKKNWEKLPEKVGTRLSPMRTA